MSFQGAVELQFARHPEDVDAWAVRAPVRGPQSVRVLGCTLGASIPGFWGTLRDIGPCDPMKSAPNNNRPPAVPERMGGDPFGY